jgi:hypothetical protein
VVRLDLAKRHQIDTNPNAVNPQSGTHSLRLLRMDDYRRLHLLRQILSASSRVALDFFNLAKVAAG